MLLSGIVITYLGRIHKIKGLDLLVPALKKVTGAHFVIAGSDDGYLPSLKKLIKKYRVEKKVTLLPATHGENKRLLFKASDIFVYPSYSEGFSLGILEAAAVGLPLILTEGCHFPEASKAGAAITVMGNSQQLGMALQKVTHSPSLRKKMGYQAKALIQKKYSMPAIGKQLLKVYQS